MWESMSFRIDLSVNQMPANHLNNITHKSSTESDCHNNTIN